MKIYLGDNNSKINLGVRRKIIKLLGIVSSGGSSSNWILALGSWNDSGIWDDNALWQDS